MTNHDTPPLLSPRPPQGKYLYSLLILKEKGEAEWSALIKHNDELSKKYYND